MRHSQFLLKHTIFKYLQGHGSIRNVNTQSNVHRVTLVEGDGIGPEISKSVQRIFFAANVPIEWDSQDILPSENAKSVSLAGLSSSFVESTMRNNVILKGPLATPIASGHKSLNLRIRKTFDLFANVRPCSSVIGVPSNIARYKNVNLLTIRENTEGEYCGIEHDLWKDSKLSYKVITADASRKIAKFAFEYAIKNDKVDKSQRKVTAVHQKSYLPITDGLFIKCCDEIARDYEVLYETMELEDVCMKLTLDPNVFDILVMPNLYGDIVSDQCAGMIGGLGLTASANLGTTCAMFEAVHGSAPDIAGKDLANPTALLLSSLMMLDYLHLNSYSSKIRNCMEQVMVKQPERMTKDVGGSSTCSQFTDSICALLYQ